jgi:DNA-binding Lrp family transcriptional regulator
MIASASPESSAVDDLDRQLVHALQIDPRVAFSRLAEVLDVSEQTVARRYRRLRSGGVVRVIGAVDPSRVGQSDWLVRVQCRPDGTTRLAQALAQRDDVAWVSVSSGGSEIVCAVRSRTQEQRDDLMLQRLPSTAQVLNLNAFMIFHRFDPIGVENLINIGDVLSAAQLRALTPPRESPGRAIALTPADEPLLAALAQDGRASLATLAKASGLGEGRVTRRLAALLASGALYFDVDVATALLGLTMTASLWLSVPPSRLEAAGEQLAEYPEVQFAAAITGPHNLTASVTCRDRDALYTFVTKQVGAIDGVSTLEVSPVLRKVKQAGALLDGERLADPAPPPRTRARSR